MSKRKTSADWRRDFINFINDLAGVGWRERLGLLHADVYAAHECGDLTHQDVKLVEAAIVRRRARQDEAITRRVTVAGHATKLVEKLGAKLSGATKPKGERTLEDLRAREERLERRRYLRDAAKIPGIVKKHYTTAMCAVLEVIRREADTTGTCELAVGTIAARAGCSERLVQSTTRRAKRFGHITVVYGVRAVNRISILSKAILNWNAKGSSATQKKEFKNQDLKIPDKGANSCRSERVEPQRSPPAAVLKLDGAKVAKTSNPRSEPSSAKSEPSAVQMQHDSSFIENLDAIWRRTGVSLHARYGLEPPGLSPQPG
ncbi:hypothetical protein [Methylobacterium frigidaeris]|uniref:Uncharacterized protein n=1 Tax=Methylobacterium frigidaeris TaxID=2038277 RepID=A0AA37HI48_9HYPH|nr:hypothetical protein [Methylobacterium frigidaeris]GJD66239.1 hypothetical protein MPEAHAMD_6436 [Methylobacterium frigidaeris]